MKYPHTSHIDSIRAPYDSHDIHMKNSLPHLFPTLPPRDFPRSPHVNPQMGTRVQKVVGPIWVSHMGPMRTGHVKPTWVPGVLADRGITTIWAGTSGLVIN